MHLGGHRQLRAKGSLMAKAPSGYVPLNMNYMRDPDIRRAGAPAEHLYIRSLAHAKGGVTDGFIGDFDLEIVAVGMQRVDQRVSALVRVGLWIETEGGWLIRNWSKWNMTGDEIRSDKTRKRDAAIATNHQRWHVAKGEIDANCRLCHPEDESLQRSDARSTQRVASGSLSEVKSSEVKSESSQSEVNVSAVASTRRSSDLMIADRQDVIRLCEHLADRIETNGSKRPVIGKGWQDAARLMLDNDNRNEQQVHAAIDWCQSDEFWRSNIQSMPKLREKYDTLRLQAQRGTTAKKNGDIDWDAAMERAKARDERNAG
jgi:hypothetical protein